MSTRGGKTSTRGKSRKYIEPEVTSDEDVSSPPLPTDVDMKKKQIRIKPQDPAILMRNMDIARSKVSVLIDSLDDDDSADNAAILKRNVKTCVKHLKEIYSLLEH